MPKRKKTNKLEDEIAELKNNGCVIHRQWNDGDGWGFAKTTWLIVEYKNLLFKLHWSGTTFFVSHSVGGSSPFDLTDYFRNLKIKAKDNHGNEYGVTMQVEDGERWSVKIEGTPGSWYLETLKEVGKRLAIDQGQGWYCENIQEVLAEANQGGRYE